MDSPDVNVLIGAFRRDSTLHTPCRAWLDAAVRGEARFCDNLLGQPHCKVVEPGLRHWTIFKRLCVETNVRGPLSSDVWCAALALELGCRFITFDRDFARFPGFGWREPA